MCTIPSFRMVSQGPPMIPSPLPSHSLLRGADELGLRKAVKAEFGGGTRGFSCEEDFIYENVESELRFFTSQVRQLGTQRISLTPRRLLAVLTPCPL